MICGLISVIIPVYNADKHLKMCIDSVLSQKNINVEILLIDDGSTEQSVEICQEYTKTHKNITFYRREHTGVSAARNFGISIAKGEFLYFLDSDDYILDGMLMKLLNAITAADMAIGSYIYRYEGKRTEKVEMKQNGIVSPIEIMHLNCLGGSKLYRTKIVQDFNIHFPLLQLGEDLSFFHCYLSVINNVSVIQEPVFVYRMHEGSLSKTYGMKALDYLMAFEIIERAYRDRPDMKMEFIYDEMFYLKGNLKRLPRYKNKKERVTIFEKYQLMAKRIATGNVEAEKIRNWILHAPKFIYCGTVPVFIYQKLRSIKHAVFRRKNGQCNCTNI